MQNQNKYGSFINALLIYSTTLVAVPQLIPYILISAIGIKNVLSDLQRNRLKQSDVFLLFFLLFSIPIYYLADDYAKDQFSKSFNDYFPYTVFIIAVIFYSKKINIDVLKYILIFIIIEAGIGIFEFMIGRPYLISPGSVEGQNEFGETTFLYYNRVYGLSQSVSVFGQKLFTGFLLLYYVGWKRYKIVLLSVLGLALVFSFNRTAIVAVLFFYGLLFLRTLKNINYKKIILLIILSITIVSVVYRYSDQIINQFFRGGSQVDLSGRDQIFPFFIDFVKNNIFFGNYVHKLWLEIGVDRVYHAHNSFLQTLANLGIFLSLFIFLFIIKKIKRNNYLYILPILVYSSFQNGILWGISYLDVIFFTFLLNQVYMSKTKALVDHNV